MIVLKIENSDFLRLVIDRKSEPIIRRHMKAPAIITQLVRLPEGELAAFVAVLHCRQESELDAQLPGHTQIELRRIVPFDKPGEPLVADRDDFHLPTITRI